MTLANIAKVHGDIYTLYLPSKPMVVINSKELARTAMITQKDAFSGRPYMFTQHRFSRGGKGLGFSDFSPTLVLNRKIVHSGLRLYQPQLEGRIMVEAEELTKRLQNHNNQPFDPKMDIFLAVVNVLYSILYGHKHLEVDDKEFLDHIEYSDGVAHLLGPLNLLNIFPWLVHFPISETKLMLDLIKKRARVRDARYYEIKKTFQENEIRHLLDALLQAMVEQEKEDVNSCGVMTDDYIMASSDALFRAGSETTTTALHWLVAVMLIYPQMQEQIYEELNEQFGGGNVSLKRKDDCHYLEATLTEILRCITVAPIFPHRTTCDTTLAGYHIPKETNVLLNIWAINHDGREWKNPEEFNPDRFLDSEGHFTGTSKMSYVPFGLGRRICPGESLAKAELFLLSATMLHKFKFELPPGASVPNLKDGLYGMTYTPKLFTVIAKQR
jgi:cytochrome P450